MATKNQVEHLFQILGREETLRRVLKGTEKMRGFIQKNVDKELSPKGQLLKELCISMGRQGAVWSKICSILIEEDLSIKNNDATFPFVKWAALIPTGPLGKYAVGKMCFPIIETEGRNESNTTAICIDGSIGDPTPLYMRSIKIPSNEEVIKQINKIFDDLVAKGLSDQGFSEEVMKEFKS